MMESVLKYFIENQGPFAILFVALLLYLMKTNQDREERLREEIKAMRESSEEELKSIQKDIGVMLQLWKVILTKELERRNTHEHSGHYERKRNSDNTNRGSAGTSNKNDFTGKGR